MVDLYDELQKLRDELSDSRDELSTLRTKHDAVREGVELLLEHIEDTQPGHHFVKARRKYVNHLLSLMASFKESEGE